MNANGNTTSNPTPKTPSKTAALLGRNVQRLRKERKLDKRTLALMSNVSRPTLHKIETGFGNPTREVLEKIAEALDVQVFDLFFDPKFLSR